MKNRILQDKSLKFSTRIVNMRNYLQKIYREKDTTSQILRSGTSIGANIAEAFACHSDADFISKLRISLKEANETMHWLKTLHNTGYITDPQFESMAKDCHDIIGLLIYTLRKKGAIGKSAERK